MPILPLLLLVAAQQQPATPIVVQAPGSGQPPATMVVEPVAMMLAGFDTDGDGRTTRAECDAGVRRSFAAIDTANKGSIGYIDYSDWALKWLGDANALPNPFTIDTDNDNRITLAELQAEIDRTFDRFDRDHDGALTHAELLTIRATAYGAGDGRGRRK